MDRRPVKIVVTGAAGLLGWHSAARLHAANCAARFHGEREPYDLVTLDRAAFAEPAGLATAVDGADAILHFAGVNRGPDAAVEAGNLAIAEALAAAIGGSDSPAHIIYANTIHRETDTPYGRSKRAAADRLRAAAPLTELILPHIFGEGARPDYNNVTATLIDRLWSGTIPDIRGGAEVELLHAGAVAEAAIAAAHHGPAGEKLLAGRRMTVADLWARLQQFHADYRANQFPDLSDPFDEALFNCYRCGGFPAHFPLPLTLREDQRGRLFETARARSGSQAFLSTTRPGQRRGDHFHLSLVERFVVVAGKAVIRVRKVLTDEVVEFRVSGDRPVAVDMPPLHTHHIVNEGETDLITFFWSNRLFDPAAPDTFADPVFQESPAR